MEQVAKLIDKTVRNRITSTNYPLHPRLRGLMSRWFEEIFSKIFFLVKWQKTLITLFSIYIINNYLNKLKIKKIFFLCFRIILFSNSNFL